MTGPEWNPDDAPDDAPEDERGGYEVGYGKPPEHSRFKPGQSGNPKGRPKGAKSFAACVQGELDSKVVVREGGQTRILSKREVIIKRLVNDGVAGNLSAIKQIAAFDVAPTSAAEPQLQRDDNSQALDQVDRDTLADWAAIALARQRGDEEGDVP